MKEEQNTELENNNYFKKNKVKIKKIIKQVQDTKIKKEVQEKVAEKNKPSIRYVGTITIKYRVLNKDNKEEPLTRTLIFDRVLKKSQLEEPPIQACTTLHSAMATKSDLAFQRASFRIEHVLRASTLTLGSIQQRPSIRREGCWTERMYWQ